MPSRKSIQDKKENNNFTTQLQSGIEKESLSPLTGKQPDSVKDGTGDNSSEVGSHVNLSKLNEEKIRNRTANVNQTFVIREDLKAIIDELVYLPGSRKRRPGTKGLLSDIANDGMARELYRRELISKEQMNKILRN